MVSEKKKKKKKKKKRMQAITRGGVNFTFTSTCGRKLCTGYTAISRKVVGQNVHATTQTGTMGYDQYTVSQSVAIEPTVFVFSALANVRQWALVPFFQISLKNCELKNTHNTFRGLSRALFSTPFLEIAVHHGSLHDARMRTKTSHQTLQYCPEGP